MVLKMGEAGEIPQNLQEQLGRLQQLQQTLQVITAQRQQVELELTEIDKALEELKKSSGDAVIYQSVGMLLVRKSKDFITKDLSEKKELLNVRSSVLGKQEEKVKAKFRELQQQLQSRLRQQPPS